MYTYWMRTIPPPTMVAFNASEREVCSVRKDHTTTPLQALTLMNNVTFIESARFIAERVLTKAGTRPTDKLDYVFQLILSRKPTAKERETLLNDFNGYLENFTKDTKGTVGLLGIGEKPRDRNLPLAEHAAWTLVANTVLNLDEAIATN